MSNSQELMQTELSNGLRVLIKEAHAAPVASFWIWYRVGSRNEHIGITGISHWVEHMLFKGTPRYPRGTADKAISREGGTFNGMTWYDMTTFFATLPAPRIDLSMEIEADRMVNASFDPDEVELERTVVISERQGLENKPEFLLSEETMGGAFRVHPYRFETIGHMCDLESITRDQLYEHYRTYYAPNNAIAVAVGDFEANDMLQRIEDHFGDVPAGPGAPETTAVEPPQKGERRVVVEDEGKLAYLQVVYHAPPVRSKDFFALTVLDAILSGASGMTFLGSTTTNKSSRLYRALISTELAVDISGSLVPTVDPFVYSLSATVRPGHTPAEVEEALQEEIERVVEDSISEQELNKAIKQAKAQFAYSSESVTGQGMWTGFSEIFADYAWFDTYVDQLSAVTLEDIQQVAENVFTTTNRTVGWYIPNDGG